MLREPRELGKCRNKSAFGDACDTWNADQGDSGVPKRRFVRIRSSKFQFSAFCIPQWGARQAVEFRQESRRSTTDLYRCFPWTGRPPKTANPRASNLFCLLLLLAQPFLPPSSQQLTRSAAHRGFPVDLFVWCRCISRNGRCKFLFYDKISASLLGECS